MLGVQKGGTTSLFAHLADLPEVLAPDRKEIQYFTDWMGANTYERLGPGWYRSHFPRRRDLEASGAITGEGSPNYIADPRAMDRIARDLPDTRWIVVLRDPTERARSQFQMMRDGGWEDRSFADAVREQLSTLDSAGDSARDSSAYVRRSDYVAQLQRLADLRPERPTLVLFSENLFRGDSESFELLLSFLGLPHRPHQGFPHLKVGAGTESIDEDTRVALAAHFARSNAGLPDLLRSASFVTTSKDNWPDWVHALDVDPG